MVVGSWACQYFIGYDVTFQKALFDVAQKSAHCITLQFALIR